MISTDATRGFMSPRAQAIREAAANLLHLHEQCESWRLVADEACSVDPAGLRDRTRKCRHLAGAAARPVTVGVFGESQAGKSYLISSLTGSKGGLVIEEPELSATGEISRSKPWAAAAKEAGGLSFIDWINAQSGKESTALVCRLTRHPVDRPLHADTFVARVISHEELLASLSVGYLAEVMQDPDQESMIKEMERALEEVEGGTRDKSSIQNLDDLESVWRFLYSQHGNDPYVAALAKAEFPQRVAELIASGRAPVGSTWIRLAGLLWGLGRNPALDELYARLSQRLAEMQMPELVEISTNAVVKISGELGQLPLTDVTLLKDMFTDSKTVKVWVRRDDDQCEREALLTRPELSALILELVLPVTSQMNAESIPLLEHADVLDFPGARSEKLQATSHPSDKSAAVDAAIAVLRRGKLTRLFSALSERREVSILCLTVPKTNLEAPRVISRLLHGWFKCQPGVVRPDLFVAITKSDLILKDFPTAKWPRDRQGFGGFIADMKGAYSSTSDEFRWLDNFGTPGQKFTDVYFVFNPRELLGKEVMDFMPEILDHYQTDSLVAAHVANARAKFDALINGEGCMRLFATDVLDRVLMHDKHGRLAKELDARRAGLLALVEREYVDPGRNASRLNPSADAERDVGELERAARDFPRTGRNVLAVLMEHLRLRPSVAQSVFRKLDRLHGAALEDGSSLSMSCADFIDGLRKAWVSSIAATFSAENMENQLGLSRDALLSIVHGWSHGVAQEWMTNAMTETLTPYFEAAVGAAKVKAGLIAAAVWAWNRELVALGKPPSDPKPVILPPRLSTSITPAWYWVIEHWRERLPVVYAGGRQPPKGNEDLGRIIKSLKVLEIIE